MTREDTDDISRALVPPPPGSRVYLQHFHLKPTVRRGAVRYLQGLNEGLCELLHHGEDQDLGCALASESTSAPDTRPVLRSGPVRGEQLYGQRVAPSASSELLRKTNSYVTGTGVCHWPVSHERATECGRAR